MEVLLTENVEKNLEFFDLFREFYLEFGAENVCILDSARGPDIDRNNSIIGLFPKFDIKVDRGVMSFESEYEDLKNKFAAEFGALSCEIAAFSDVFPRIKKIFGIESNLDYSNGLIGYFGYEYLHYINEIERKNIDDLGMPDVHLTYYSHLLIQNTKDSSVKLSSNFITEDVSDERKKILSFIETKKEISPKENYEIKTGDIENTVSREEFLEKVKIAQDYISKDEICQVILGNRKKINTNAKSIDIYCEIRKVNPSPYMFFWERGGYSLIGNSPELQLKIENQHMEIRPIGGTSKGKGQNEEERQKLLADLINCPKERAEHVMLVDLAQSDIGVYAEKGTVKVDKFMMIEEYSNVFHIVSIVSGKIPQTCNKMKIFEASFPAGTLTGAPKIRAMEIIQELEKYERGVYGGAFGFFDFNGNILSSIAIRTAIKIGNNVYFQSSAGIVAASNPEDEWNETQFKAAAIKSVIERK